MNGRVKTFLNQDIEFPAESRRQIENLLSLDDIREIVVLPDVHTKAERVFPKGITVLTKNTIYPNLVSEEMGCGIRTIKTDLTEQDLTGQRGNSVFLALMNRLKEAKAKKGILTKNEYNQLLTKGAGWIKDKYPLWALPRNLSYYNDENSKTRAEVIGSLPEEARRKGYLHLGDLGGGNHFLEMHVVRELVDKIEAGKAGLKEGQIVFILHTGGILPGILSRYYAQGHQRKTEDKKFKRNLRRFLFHFNDLNFLRLSYRLKLFSGNSIRGIPADTPEGKKFFTGLWSCLNYTLANRCFFSGLIASSLEEVFGKEIDTQVLSDVPHETISREGFGSEKFWVHRYGASRVLPQDIIYMPSYMGEDSYFCRVGEGIRDSRFSVNHGVGRSLSKSEARISFKKEQVEDFLDSRKVRLYDLGNLNMLEQAPFVFKNIERVIRNLKGYNLAEPLARTSPLAILKG